MLRRLDQISQSCIFCGGSLYGKKSKEHIFPQWLQNHLQISKKELHQYLYPDEQNGQPSQSRNFTFNNLVYSRVCSVCNSGWMSELENKMIPILIPLLDGTFSGTIEWKKLQMIAYWSFKTGIILHNSSIQKKYIPVEHYQAVYRKVIPAGVIISLANFKGGKNEIQWIQNQNWRVFPALSPDQAKYLFSQTYRITMRISRLVVRICYWPFNDWLFNDFENGIIHILPPQLEVSWPPSGFIDDIFEFDKSSFISMKHNWSDWDFSLEIE